MYSTCIFCHSGLGANESIENFPIGRRLAFDAARGRLWVVCRKCERWNLTPLEERWEAIEECERQYTATRLRVSTDNIGLAKLRGGLELVRVGSPLRPEMAAWRYGDQFGRRRRRHIIYTGAAGLAIGGLIIAGPATGILAGGGWGLWNLVNQAHNAYQQRRVRARIAIDDSSEPLPIRLRQLREISVVRTDDGWGLGVLVPSPRVPMVLPGGHVTTRLSRGTGPGSVAILTGDAAMRAAAKVLPAINASGAKQGDVSSAVDLIGEVAEPGKLFERFANDPPRMTGRRWGPPPVPGGHVISGLPKEVRLALEMATHEESERRALEGELALLEAEWRQAEEIAAISDDMFVSDETRAKLSELKRGE